MDGRKKILALCTYQRDIRELSKLRIKKKYDVVFEQSSRQWLQQLCQSTLPEKDVFALVDKAIDVMCDYYVNNDIDAIVSTVDYPGNIMRAAINERLQLPGPSLQAVLGCEHKYYSRLIQKKSCSGSVPDFQLIHNKKKVIEKFPLLLKPVKSSFSTNVFVVHSQKEFLAKIKKAPLPFSFLHVFNYFIKRHTTFEYDACNILAERFVTGYQVTIEGFVVNSEVTVFGITDSYLVPGTISFLRFEYPSNLTENVQKRMYRLAEKVIRAIGLDNSLFNIECIYNPAEDRIYIIEINPRISSQFADLYERVEGYNTYEFMLDIAVGKMPKLKKNTGPFNVAASCVLRSLHDMHVLKIPSYRNIKRVKELFPDMELEICALLNKRLSHVEQDSQTFRYGLIHMGGYDREDLLHRLEICKALLDFRFERVKTDSV